MEKKIRAENLIFLSLGRKNDELEGGRMKFCEKNLKEQGLL
jgi:hypothetical protein